MLPRPPRRHHERCLVILVDPDQATHGEVRRGRGHDDSGRSLRVAARDRHVTGETGLACGNDLP